MQTDAVKIVELRGLNEFVYCPRLYHFMYVEKVFVESADTIEGEQQHRSQKKRIIYKKSSIDENDRNNPVSSTILPKLSYRIDEEEVEDDTRPFVTIPRNFKFGDEKVGLVGILDAIEASEFGIAPVESKHSVPPDGRHEFAYKDISLPGSVWPNDLAQLAGQIYLLRKNGYSCNRGFLYYRGSRRRFTVHWEVNLEHFLQMVLQEILAMPEERPLPLKNSKKCLRCSLHDVCLPDETWTLQDHKEEIKMPRKIIAARYDRSILHITDSRAKIGVSGDNIRVIDASGKVSEFHLKDVLSVSIYGNAQISTQAVTSCLSSDIPIVYLGSSGRLKGIIQPFSGKNLDYRIQQYKQFEKGNPILAAATVAAKIANQRTFLRRNSELDDSYFSDLKNLTEKAESCTQNESLLGYEGSAARIYYGQFSEMIIENFRGFFHISGRNRRPPKDPINALLSFAYTMLARDATIACVAAGLDPNYGFFHTKEKGRPSLALDLMEPFRSIIADSAVVRAINTGMIQADDFESTPAGTIMKERAKKGIIRAYEARANTEITHPKFEYAMSYRRILEVEVRMLARYLEGELPNWQPLRVR